MSVLCRLYEADCVELLRRLPENSIDLIFADPPYNLSNDGVTCHAGRMVSVNKGTWDKSQGVEADYLFHLKWISECRRVLKPSGTLWISGTYHSIYSCGHVLRQLQFHILNDICWFKPNASPNLSCRFFTASHETLIWARREKGSRHMFNYDEMKKGHFPEDKLKIPEKQMRSVWCIPSPGQSEKRMGKHPTQKPIALLDRIIRASSKPNDIVLDPFCGSGTTGVSAIRNGRNFVGIERDWKYVELSARRISASLNGEKLKVEVFQNRGESDALSSIF